MTTELPGIDTLIATLEHDYASSEADRVGAAVTVAAELGALGDQLVTHFVSAARAAGCSWSQIGEQLGVSKQAAQQGFVAPPRRGRFGRHLPVRMSEATRSAVTFAQEEARALHHDFIGTEHLLLGVLGQPTSPAARALADRGATPDAVRATVEAMVGQSACEPRAGHLPLGKRSKKVLQLALREAVADHQRAIGPEHLLLAILGEGEGLACKILVDSSVDLRELRTAVLAGRH